MRNLQPLKSIKDKPLKLYTIQTTYYSSQPPPCCQNTLCSFPARCEASEVVGRLWPMDVDDSRRNFNISVSCSGRIQCPPMAPSGRLTPSLFRSTGYFTDPFFPDQSQSTIMNPCGFCVSTRIFVCRRSPCTKPSLWSSTMVDRILLTSISFEKSAGK